MKISVAVLALIMTVVGSVAAVASVPLPRPRPVEQAAPAAEPAEEPKKAEAPAKPSACQVGLKALAEFAREAPVDGAGECGIADPVRLQAVILPDKARVALNPPALLRCEMATAVAHWVRDGMAPAAMRLGSPLRGIENFNSYECRGRNRVFGAKMSEHGRGNALDIRGVKLRSGTIAHLTDAHVTKAVRNDLRTEACDRFMTVLGPGSDGYHENHIHVDLAERRSGYRICQWEVRQPLDRVSPSPHIASSRAPTPLESMTMGMAKPASTTVPLPPKRRAAGRRQFGHGSRRAASPRSSP